MASATGERVTLGIRADDCEAVNEPATPAHPAGLLGCAGFIHSF